MFLLLVATPDVTAQEVVDTTFRDIVIVEDSVIAGAPEKLLPPSPENINKENDRAGKQVKDWNGWRPNVKKAMWMAIIIPGGGQIYNRKYWKLPIVYGGFVGCAYALRWNGQMYSDYDRAYRDMIDGDESTDSYMKFIHLGNTTMTQEEIVAKYKPIFKSRRDKFRRWRDLSIFCMIGVYALSIVDAYVDASLSEFDISEDLTMKVSPAFIDGRGQKMMASRNALQNNGLGVRCKLNF
ncbi:MAG: DUF5683 domain-containing protein [Bacteroidales bacterium]|nr:DUF5683 domain-containing protein [Bacteroidales bacterium]MCM1147618.1 DUF5683 domain-containing protein [Bacteroidales bacterium]MCM1206409.1 DUF5683 domain-containing protein [Bacillota bacterium]MCM1509143.1 DUF5683 domain-containing protein [Clostridium sp.]